MGRDRGHQPYREQSVEETIGNTHRLVNDDRANLKMRLWRRGRGFYFKNKHAFTHTLIPTYSQPEKKRLSIIQAPTHVCPGSAQDPSQ